MKRWPKDRTKTVDAELLIKPVIQALHFAYNMKRRNRDLDIKYTGYNIGPTAAVTCLDAVSQLKAKNLIYCEEDQGYQADEEILALMFRLGVEQGYRLYQANHKHFGSHML